MDNYTIFSLIERYLKGKQARNPRSYHPYFTAMERFKETLEKHNIDLASPAENLEEYFVEWFIDDIQGLATSTIHLYLSIVRGLYRFAQSQRIKTFNTAIVDETVQQKVKRVGQRIPAFPRREIEQLIDYANRLAETPWEKDRERLINLRDRALILTLADTGLRIHEACDLKRGQLDLMTRRAMIIGKGDKQAIIRFSPRAVAAIRDYLLVRHECGMRVDGSSPMFARHDKSAGDATLPISTTTGRKIISERVSQAVQLDGLDGDITPHSLRHRFVTEVLAKTKNLKLAQSLARHANINTTQRYAHLTDDELDSGYTQVFEGEE